MVTYENIQFRKPNMAVVGGYFYMMDENWDVLLQKTDDGSTAFSYPLNTTINNTVSDLQYDGANFWTLENVSNGLYIKRWRIEENLVFLKNSFWYEDDDSYTYDSNAFAVEHYNTQFTCTVMSGSNIVCMGEYYDTVVSGGLILSLGPNNDGDREEVTVSGVIGSNVILVSGTNYTYTSGDAVNLYKSFFIFNNYDGTDSTNGTLFRFNAYTGDYITSDVRSDYKNVSACTFERLQNVLDNYDDVHTLIYVKGTNAKLRNMNDLIAVTNASSADDDFNGSDGSLPDTIKWNIIEGNPRIYDNKLFCSSIFSGNDAVQSNYRILGDFDVQVSGAIGGYTTHSGNDNTFNHCMRFTFPSSSDHWCEISRLLVTDYNNTTFSYQHFAGDPDSWEVTINSIYLLAGDYNVEWDAYDKDYADEISLRLEKDATIIDVYGTGTADNNWLSQSNSVNIPEDGIWTIKGRQHYEPYFVWGIRYPALSYNGDPANIIVSRENKNVENAIDGVSASGINNYMFRVTRVDDQINFYYKFDPSSSWLTLGSGIMYSTDCKLELGLYTDLTVSGSWFEDLQYNAGNIIYPLNDIPYYDVMTMDNIRDDLITTITVYDVAVQGTTLYRLQQEGTYYGIDNAWGSKYNYQVSPIRSFVDAISVGADPTILPANGLI